MKKLTNTPNLTELSYRSIKEQLLVGTLREGARLTEEQLSSQLGISKSPVREALNRLEAEGLICIEARRGAYVREFSPKEVKDLYDFREVLELHSIASAEITPALLSKLADSIDRTKMYLESGDKAKHVEEDLYFHATLASASGNDEFSRVFQNIQQKSLLCRYKTYHLSGGTAPASHGKIYLALCANDRPAAMAAMSEHVRYVKDRLVEALQIDETSHREFAAV
ncbi:GntR family transcriptional regulator [Silvibacterium sp.]|uniref:GntR family transcriptional regulator n=1 Tax=Silvibacterium sp. TaxID=1964179 RepID=UPI0039E4717B